MNGLWWPFIVGIPSAVLLSVGLGRTRLPRLARRTLHAVDRAADESNRLALAALIGIASVVVLFPLLVLLGEVLADAEASVDIPVFDWVAERLVDGSAVERFSSVATAMGDPLPTQVFVVAASIALAPLWGRRFWLPPLAIAGTYAVERFGQNLLADIVDRGHPITSPGTYPSGGMARLIAVVGIALVLVSWRFSAIARHRRLIAHVLAAAAAIEAVTRTILLKHWVTDVVGGAVYGIVLLGVAVLVVRALHGPPLHRDVVIDLRDAPDDPQMIDYIAGRVARPERTEHLLAIPNRGNARFVVPGDRRSTAARSVLSHNALRDRRTRFLRRVTALGLRIGAWRAIGAGPVDRREHEREPLGQGALLDHLAERLAIPDLTFAVGLDRRGPHAKPVLQLFTADGHAAGFAKIGWNDATAPLVRAEGDALEQIGATPPTAFSVPDVLVRTDLGGDPVLVTAPISGRGRRGTVDDVLAAIKPAELAGAGAAILHEALATLPLWHRTSAIIDADTTLSEVVDDLRAPLEGRSLDIGRGHGDLVPWNVGFVDGHPWVFDWEHSERIPVGVDHVHGIYQTLIDLQGWVPEEAFREAERRSIPYLRAAGLRPFDIDGIHRVHRLLVIDRVAAAGVRAGLEVARAAG